MNILGIGAVFLDDEHCIVGYIDEKEEWIAVRGRPAVAYIHDMTVKDVEEIMEEVKKKSYVYVLPKKYPILLAKGAMYFRKPIPEK